MKHIFMFLHNIFFRQDKENVIFLVWAGTAQIFFKNGWHFVAFLLITRWVFKIMSCDRSQSKEHQIVVIRKIFLCFYTTYFFDKLWKYGFSSSSWNDAKWPPKNLSASNQIRVTLYITKFDKNLRKRTGWVPLDLKFVETYTSWVFK